MKKLIILMPLIIFSFMLTAQHKTSLELVPIISRDVKPVICYTRPEVMNTVVPLPDYIKERLNNTGQRLAANSDFQVTYIGFTPEAQAAFQYAVDIWASLLTSDIPIKIKVEYKSLDAGVLASTGWGSLHANFKNAQKNGVWYVASMAEKIAGIELNDPEDFEIVMSFNTGINWYQGTDQNTPNDQYDMVSVVLHEIGHGLGYFSHTFIDDSDIGSYTLGTSEFPIVFDALIENGDGESIITTYDNNSSELANQLTSNNVFFRSFSFENSEFPKLYAPSQWNSGSSIAHLDENKYGAGNPNSLMSPQLGLSESIHDPGLSLDQLNDMGWISMKIEHLRLTDTESLSSPYPITSVIKGDNGLKAGATQLHYSYDKWASENSVEMMSTGTLDEYSANIPSIGAATEIYYYISVEDVENRIFTSPGEANEFSHHFIAAPDTIAPVIDHTPLTAVFIHNLSARILAKVTDNMGTQNLVLTYKVNGGSETSFDVPLASFSDDGSYIGNYDYQWDLSSMSLAKGDLLEYKLEVIDIASTPNKTSNPGVGFNLISIDALNPLEVQYFNDFNTASDDFVGFGFSIKTEQDFSSAAISNSSHPYRSINGESASDTVILSYLLKTPIKLNPKGAIIEFDEVVLVEPGESGTVYGNDQFWDYVIVEGSTDFGITWKPLVQGYDSREDAKWEERYNSDIVENPPGADSNAKGDEELMRHKVIDMLENGNFNPNEEVLIRFKLYADQLAAGWGWLIDNVKIQIDDTPPVIAHNAPDYLQVGDTEISLRAKVTDNVEVGLVKFTVAIDGAVTEYIIDGPGEDFELVVQFTNPVAAATLFEYSIYAEDIDTNKNSSVYPVSGKIKVPVAIMSEPVSVYLNDFNTSSDDFIGANYTIKQEAGFDDMGINSVHPYSDSPSGIDTLSYLLKYPIILNDGFAFIKWKEVVLVDYLGDVVALQGSKDQGITWHNITKSYSSSLHEIWFDEYEDGIIDENSTTTGNKNIFKTHLVDVLSVSEFSSGDEVWLRFSMMLDGARHGWGWLIDDLEIQGPTTGLEDNLFSQFSIYPNPVANKLLISGKVLLSKEDVLISIKDQLGREVYYSLVQIKSNNLIQKSVDVSSLKKGLYVLHMTDGISSTTRKFIKN